MEWEMFAPDFLAALNTWEHVFLQLQVAFGECLADAAGGWMKYDSVGVGVVAAWRLAQFAELMVYYTLIYLFFMNETLKLWQTIKKW